MQNKTIIASALIIVFLLAILIFSSKSVDNSRTQSSAGNTTNTADTTNTTASTDGSTKLTQLGIETTTEGTGDRQVKTGDKISVHYVGTYANGTKFDSSRDRGQPFQFTVGQGVIEGWSEGVVGMKKGEVRKLSIPSDLGYGPNDYNGIPGGSDLYFEIELLDFVN